MPMGDMTVLVEFGLERRMFVEVIDEKESRMVVELPGKGQCLNSAAA